MIHETVEWSLLDADPKQPRRSINKLDIDQLQASIERLGQLQPIVVYRNGPRFCIVDGHCRALAIGRIGGMKVAALVLDKRPAPNELLLTQYSANCMRVDLTPMEKAKALSRLQKLNGWSNAELAGQLKMSKSQVTQLLSYLKLPPEIQKQLDDGKLAGSTAYAISRAPDEATRNDLLTQATNGTLKRDEASRRVNRKASTRKPKRATFSITGADICFATSDELDFTSVVDLCQHLIRECRKAEKEGLNVSTFRKVLIDRRRSVKSAS